MELTGKVIKIEQPITGKSAKGPWKKQEIIIETDDKFPRKVCFMSWNDKVALEDFKPGEEITVHFNAESREYNGRWYTDLKVWKIDSKAESNNSDTPPPPPPHSLDDMPPEDYGKLDEGDLPF